MKKLVFSLFCFISSIYVVNAFNIDVDKIEITSKSNSLINSLDKSYSIDVSGFSKEEVYDQKIIDVTKELINISLSDKNEEDKLKDFASYVYIDPNNGFSTLNSNVFIRSFVSSINKYDIDYDYIKVIRSVKCSEGILSFAYLDDVKVNDEVKDLVLVYWLKEVNGSYKLHYPWFTIDDLLEDFYNRQVDNENNGNVISGTYKKLSLEGNSSTISDDELLNIYNNNVLSNVQITAMYDNGVGSYGSGFFIREGIVVTTWSLFLDFLSNCEYIYVNDSLGNTYKIDGIVSADAKYDVVLLKLDKETGKRVSFGSDVKTDDKLFMINSKINSGFSISYGSNISNELGRLKNLFMLTSSDVGSAIYNVNGEVVGFNTGEVLYSDLSIANSTDYLKKIQSLLIDINFSDINVSNIESFKDNYYNVSNEEVISNVSDNILDKYNSIGNYKDTIMLDLVKSSYKDNILSLRYKNNISNSLSSMYLVSDYVDNLLSNGYTEVLNKYNKKVLKNDKYKVVIKENMNYLIIIIMEI